MGIEPDHDRIGPVPSDDRQGGQGDRAPAQGGDRDGAPGEQGLVVLRHPDQIVPGGGEFDLPTRAQGRAWNPDDRGGGRVAVGQGGGQARGGGHGAVVVVTGAAGEMGHGDVGTGGVR